MGLRTKEMAEATAVFSVEAAGGVYNYKADVSIGVDRRIRNGCGILRKHTLELYGRPSATLELKIRILRAEELETILYAFVTLRARARATAIRCADPTIAF